MNIIIFGAPGSGKGTQAERVNKKLGTPAISTGHILRSAIAEQTQTGLEAKEYVDSGKLVPDGIMLRLIKERLAQPDCVGGYILDGYPRTLPQAEGLDDAGVKIDAVLSIEISDEEIERRITGRRVCQGCDRSYHILYNPPLAEGKCDNCGAALYCRMDDSPDVVKARLRVYHETTEPLKGWYEGKGLLKSVVSDEEVTVTTERVYAALQL
jgi:adenylate kinase